MSRATSLYLDLVRFLSALVVFLGHYSSQRLSGGLFWQFQAYGHVSVITFFVLSGLVVTYASEEKDRTLNEFCLSRLSRLYSVVLPAIIVTLLADAIGTRVAPELYSSDWGYADTHPILRVISAITFTSDIWFLNVQPFSEGPFWSLPYEFWYYVLFGVAYFFRGRLRWQLAILAAFIAGPRILFLFPVWLMGVGVYRIMCYARLSAFCGWSFLLSSILGFVVLQSTHLEFLSIHLPDGLLPAVVQDHCCADNWAPYGTGYDYLYGLLFALNFVGFRFAGDFLLPVLNRFKSQIRWLAGLTFSLYLFHMPLLQVFAAISPWSSSSPTHRFYLFVATLGTTIVLSHLTEHRRDDLRRWLAHIIPASRPAAQQN